MAGVSVKSRGALNRHPAQQRHRPAQRLQFGAQSRLGGDACFQRLTLGGCQRVVDVSRQQFVILIRHHHAVLRLPL